MQSGWLCKKMNPQLRLATKKDDNKIREILRNNPIEGKISLAYCREPSYFNSINIDGKNNQVMVGELDGKIIGFGAKAVKRVFINGVPTEVGYLSGLRLEKEYRGNGLLKYGYLYLKKLHQKNTKVKLYYSTIIDDNWLAKKILTGHKPYLPRYMEIGRINVIAIRLLNGIRINANVQIIKGNKKLSKKIFDFLKHEGKKKQFFPYYTRQDLNKPILMGLNINDFYLAIKNNEIIGVCAKWDQESFKQTIITGYSWIIKIGKKLFNLNAKRKRFPLLPDINKPFHYFYLSFIVTKGNDVEIFKALLNKVYNDNINTKYSYFIFGLSENDSLMEAVNIYKYVNYPSTLYAVFWKDGKKEFEKLDNRIPYIEVAAL